MFERFTAEARQVVVDAQHEARRLHHGSIGTEHLLLSLLGRQTPSSAVLARHGLTKQDVAQAVIGHVRNGDLDAEALTTLGIDLDAVRDRVESAFGPGALDDPFRRRGATAAGSRDPAVGLRAVRSLRVLVERLEALQVGNARDQGWTWDQIAQLLGVTRQAVHKKYASGRGPLRRKD